MKKKTKIMRGLFILIIVLTSIFLIRIKKFAGGVKEDAKRKKEYNEKKLSDSTTVIFKKAKIQ
jgi:hypothetical protein